MFLIFDTLFWAYLYINKYIYLKSNAAADQTQEILSSAAEYSDDELQLSHTYQCLY